MGELFKALLYSLFPRRCPLCGDMMVGGERDFCSLCRSDMPLTGYWMRKKNPLTELFAGRVMLDSASSLMFFRHDSTSQRAIHQLKYLGNRSMAISLGRIYGRYLAQSNLYDDVEILVPVPLHWSRRWNRGYNQSELFCQGMALEMNLRVETGALRRVRATAAQARKKSRTERWSNVEGAFCLCHPDRIVGRGVMLVDDVITTGATIEACARAISDVLPEQRIWIGSAATVRSAKR